MVAEANCTSKSGFEFGGLAQEMTHYTEMNFNKVAAFGKGDQWEVMTVR